MCRKGPPRIDTAIRRLNQGSHLESHSTGNPEASTDPLWHCFTRIFERALNSGRESRGGPRSEIAVTSSWGLKETDGLHPPWNPTDSSMDSSLPSEAFVERGLTSPHCARSCTVGRADIETSSPPFSTDFVLRNFSFFEKRW